MKIRGLPFYQVLPNVLAKIVMQESVGANSFVVAFIHFPTAHKFVTQLDIRAGKDGMYVLEMQVKHISFGFSLMSNSSAY